MTTTSKPIPQLVVALTFVFGTIAGVASAAPNQHTSRRAQPKLSVMTWQGGNIHVAQPKVVVQPAVRPHYKPVARPNYKPAMRPNNQPAARPNYKPANKQAGKRNARFAKRSSATAPVERNQVRHARRLQKFDSNRDGKLSLAGKAKMRNQRFARMDADHNGTISPAEKRAAKAKRSKARKNRS